MNLPHSTFKLTLLFLALNFFSVVHSQTEKINTFLEIHSGVMHYETQWNKRLLNPVFGMVMNTSVSKRISLELYYTNAWIKEDMRFHSQGSDYYYVREEGLAHWIGFRVGFGKQTPDYSIRVLIGISAGKHVGLDLGTRYTKNISDQFSFNASIIAKGYLPGQFSNDSEGYTEVMATPLLLNFQVGIGYHF